MKKITALFLAILMLMLCLPSAFAADTVISVVDQEICIDETNQVVVPVAISGNPGFASVGFEISYDNSVLTPVSVTATSNLTGAILIPNLAFDEDTIKVAVTNYMNMTFEGDILNVTFTVSEDALGEYPIDVNCLELNTEGFAPIPFEVVDGTVTVTKNEPDPTPAPTEEPVVTPEPVPAVVESAGMVDTTDIEGPNKSITSFMTVINTNDESVDALTWNVSYDGTSKSYYKKYDTVFTGTVKLGLYIENLYVADENLLDVDVELGKGE